MQLCNSPTQHAHALRALREGARAFDVADVPLLTADHEALNQSFEAQYSHAKRAMHVDPEEADGHLRAMRRLIRRMSRWTRILQMIQL